jgi:rhamnosyltransferase
MNMPTVAVLMSSYNGERYIEQQIESVLGQAGVEATLYVRDDGSTDGTVAVVEQLKQQYANRIQLSTGVNVGYVQSFLCLLRTVPDDYEYYCFSDQDDVWSRDKIVSAIARHQSDVAERWVYVSALDYVDEHLNFLKTRDYSDRSVTLPSLFTRMRFAGCTMVFPRIVQNDCQNILQRHPQGILNPHDQFVLAVSLAYGGVVDVDHTSHIRYRRSTEAVTAGGRSMLTRLRYECRRVMTKDSLDVLSDMLLGYGTVSSWNTNYLNVCARYRKNHHAKLRLLSATVGSSGNPILDFEALIKIVFSTF